MYKKYIEQAGEKLHAAKYLLKGKYYNDAVSRAYYSMFYAAKALLSTRDIYPKGHKGVVIKTDSGENTVSSPKTKFCVFSDWNS